MVQCTAVDRWYYFDVPEECPNYPWQLHLALCIVTLLLAPIGVGLLVTHISRTPKEIKRVLLWYLGGVIFGVAIEVGGIVLLYAHDDPLGFVAYRWISYCFGLICFLTAIIRRILVFMEIVINSGEFPSVKQHYRWFVVLFNTVNTVLAISLVFGWIIIPFGVLKEPSKREKCARVTTAIVTANMFVMWFGNLLFSARLLSVMTTLVELGHTTGDRLTRLKTNIENHKRGTTSSTVALGCAMIVFAVCATIGHVFIAMQLITWSGFVGVFAVSRLIMGFRQTPDRKRSRPTSGVEKHETQFENPVSQNTGTSVDHRSATITTSNRSITTKGLSKRALVVAAPPACSNPISQQDGRAIPSIEVEIDRLGSELKEETDVEVLAMTMEKEEHAQPACAVNNHEVEVVA